VFTRTFDNIYPQFRLAPYFIVGNCCVRDGGGGGGGVWGGGGLCTRQDVSLVTICKVSFCALELYFQHTRRFAHPQVFNSVMIHLCV